MGNRSCSEEFKKEAVRLVEEGQLVERVAIDPESGARALNGCPARVPEYFLEGTVPKRTCPEWGEAGRPASGSEGLRGFLRRLFGGEK